MLTCRVPTVFSRGYAEPASGKFSRAKPHLNIGTIGMSAQMLLPVGRD